MSPENNYLNSYETAFLFSSIHGLIRLIAIVSAFFFWLCMSVLAWLSLSSWHELYSYLQVLGLVGLSPVLLTVISWRIIEKGYSYYLQRYAEKHTVSKKGENYG